jgi:hypothetical protein
MKNIRLGSSSFFGRGLMRCNIMKGTSTRRANKPNGRAKLSGPSELGIIVLTASFVASSLYFYLYWDTAKPYL